MRGTITTVIGPNGAGKSTVFKTVFGMLPARSGRIAFEGGEITNLQPRDLLARGISYVPQGRNIFPELSVRHNLELGGVAVRVSSLPLSPTATCRRPPGSSFPLATMVASG